VSKGKPTGKATGTSKRAHSAAKSREGARNANHQPGCQCRVCRRLRRKKDQP
jgi:hypothetical protein